MGKRRFAVTGDAFDSATSVSRYSSVGVTSHTRGWDSGVKVIARNGNEDDVFEVWTTGGSHDTDEKIYLGKLVNGEWVPAC